MFCEKCGTQLEDGMVFCPECGNKVSNPETEKADTISETVVDSVSDDETTIIYEMSSNNKEETSSDSDEVVLENDSVVEPEMEAESTNVPEMVMENVVAPGAIIETSKIKYCHNCGAANAETDAFCYACGMPIGENGETKKKKDSVLKKLNKKIIIGIAAAVAVVLATIIIIVAFPFGKSKNTLFYLKDNEFTHYVKKDSLVFGDEVYEDKDDAYGPNSSISSLVTVSEDGKYVFYPQNFDGGAFDLYYKKINGKSEGEKIDSNISQYSVLKNNKVLYKESGSSDKLYISDLKDKEKVASDVSWYWVSEDEKKVLWRTSDGENKAYVRDLTLKNDKIKIDSDISSMVYISDDLKKIVYTKDDTLYYVENFDNKEKIDSDIASQYVVKNDSKVEIYYLVDADESVTFNDLIEDDYAAQDAKMKEPNISDYQTIESKPSFWGTREEVVTDESYYEDLEKYNEKEARDYIREYIGEQEILSNYIMYRYIPGEKDAEEYTKGAIWNCNSYGTPVLLYSELDIENSDKIKLSQLVNQESYEIESTIWEKLGNEALKSYMISNGKKVELDVDFEEYDSDVRVCAIDKNKKECYLEVNEADGDQINLFKTSYGKADGKLELVSDEYGDIEVVSDKGVYYTTELEDGYQGELYFNDQKIDSDVLSGSVLELGNGEGILYLTDPDDQYQEGTLKMYQGSKSIKISDDVAAYVSNDKGEVAFLEDYNFGRYRGDLKVFKNNKATLIESDVTSILYY